MHAFFSPHCARACALTMSLLVISIITWKFRDQSLKLPKKSPNAAWQLYFSIYQFSMIFYIRLVIAKTFEGNSRKSRELLLNTQLERSCQITSFRNRLSVRTAQGASHPGKISLTGHSDTIKYLNWMKLRASFVEHKEPFYTQLCYGLRL
jgi:hypothetical protein